MTTASIVSKVWSFCTTLRDDGVGYGDYLERIHAEKDFLQFVTKKVKMKRNAA